MIKLTFYFSPPEGFIDQLNDITDKFMINICTSREELESSLPILGIDGTVKRRFRDSDMAGYAHLKTGTLHGVKSIAGYVKAHDGKQWIVVFIVNNRNAALAGPAQDAMIEWLQKEH